MNKQLLLVFIAILVLASCKHYSEGWRSGVLIKFSNRGFIWKTYEGTINLGGLKKAHDKDNNESFVANTWEFSLDREHQRNENVQAISDSLNKALDNGLMVKVHYNQERSTNCVCQRGDENYFVDSVKLIY